MLKNLFSYIIVFIILGTISYFAQISFFNENLFNIFELLQKAYIFHLLFSLIIVVGFKVLSKNSRFFEQLGFIYLVLLVIKIIAFIAAFYPYFLGGEPLPISYRAALLIPVCLFLILEVFFISKILRSKKP